MPGRVGKFLCVVPPKTLRVDVESGRATRSGPVDGLEEALDALEFKTSRSTLDGGGVAIGVGPGIQAFTDNELIVSFVGHLTNVDYLAWRLFSDEGRRGESAPSALEAARQLVGGRCFEAELVCHLYKTFGTKALPKLRGKFAFVVFDSKSVRVFAARDVSGEYDLKYARDDDGTVVVANFSGASEMLPSRRDLSEIPPGCYVYGHRNMVPSRFAKTLAEKSSELAAAAAAATRALRGLNVKSRRPLDVRRISSDHYEHEDVLCDDRKRALEDLDGGHEYESHERANEEEDIEPGTEEDHRTAEVVALKTASAAIKRIASGYNMTGMVRMDGVNALAAVGMADSGNLDGFQLDRVPSRTGLLSDMVKVASFGDLNKEHARKGSISDLMHTGVSSPKKSGLDKPDRRASWTDLTVLVASGETRQANSDE